MTRREIREMSRGKIKDRNIKSQNLKCSFLHLPLASKTSSLPIKRRKETQEWINTNTKTKRKRVNIMPKMNK